MSERQGQRARRDIERLEARQRQLGEAFTAAGGRTGKRTRALEQDLALLVQLNRALLRLLISRGAVTLEEVRAEMTRGSDGDITSQDLLDEFGLPDAEVDAAKRFSASAKPRKRPRFD